MTVKIRATGLQKHFGAVKAVDGIDLAVSAGEIYGLLGPNGAGKTTTLRTILGYLRPTAGASSVLDGDARSPAIRRCVGYLPGDLRLEPKAKVGSLLDYYAALRGGVDPAYVDELCERFLLDRDRRFGELSKGNKQKVGVIQAVMHQPEVLLLDEPTGGLDPLMQREVLRLVTQRRDAGAAILLSSHLIFEVEEIADRVGIMRTGKIVIEDSVSGLQQFTARQSMHVRFNAPVSPDDFAGIALERVETHENTADIVVQGDVGPLLGRLSALGAAHISTDPLVLDDIFYGVYDHSESQEVPA